MGNTESHTGFQGLCWILNFGIKGKFLHPENHSLHGTKLSEDNKLDMILQDVAQVLAKEFPQQIDVAYEGVGGKLRDAVLANLSPKGRVLAVGYISDYPHNDSR